MNIFDRYVAYLKDNPKKLWFKRKLYGWGWTPATWQGWLVLLVYIVLLIVLAGRATAGEVNTLPVREFLLPVVFLTVALIGICYLKGEPPRWQWGLPKDENSNR